MYEKGGEEEGGYSSENESPSMTTSGNWSPGVIPVNPQVEGCGSLTHLSTMVVTTFFLLGLLSPLISLFGTIVTF